MGYVLGAAEFVEHVQEVLRVRKVRRCRCRVYVWATNAVNKKKAGMVSPGRMGKILSLIKSIETR